MSNELNTPKILFCPTEYDRTKKSATVFRSGANGHDIPFTSNTNLSYFVGVDAVDANPQAFLSGDHNLTNGTPLVDELLLLSTNAPVSWTDEMHHRQGNVLLSDGSVQALSTFGIRSAVADLVSSNKWLQMP
jgi:hypothetical protein